jgi:Galactose oxidase, central domain/Kelch motif
MRRAAAIFLASLGVISAADTGVSRAASLKTDAKPSSADVVDLIRARIRQPTLSGTVRSLASVADGLRPLLETAPGGDKPAEVVLPKTARDGTRVTDPVSGVSVRFTLREARSSPAQVEEGLVIYRDALGAGQHLLHIVSKAGTEDLVALDRPVTLKYDVDLSGVAGLRLIAETLEFLDQGGAPRLRISPPWSVDLRGARAPAHLSVESCTVSDDPRPPWGQAPTPPGASRCVISVTPDPSQQGPIVIDPTWQTAGNMAVKRFRHALVLLSTGRALAIGGQDANGVVLSSAELFDPGTRTWAATGSMKTQRTRVPPIILPSGQPLATGGEFSNTPASSCELYDVALGKWSYGPSMNRHHTYHTATLLESGDVLVAGGSNQNGIPSPDSETYSSSSGWTLTSQPMISSREFHTATLLASGQVLAAGGNAPGEVATAESYDPGSRLWTPAGSMHHKRAEHVAGLLSDGGVVVLGGRTSAGGALAFAEVYSPSVSSWQELPAYPMGSYLPAAQTIGNGCFLVSGGFSSLGFSTSTNAVRAFDPKSVAWQDVGSMNVARGSHAMAVLADGSLLVSGGNDLNGGGTVGAETLALSPVNASCMSNCECASGLCQSGKCCQGVLQDGAACSSACECVSGNCVDGVCCDGACKSPCVACSAKAKGQGADGKCSAVAAGHDFRGDCSAEDPSTCGTTGVCDGNGACAKYPNKSECSPAVCRGHQLIASECNNAQCAETPTDCSPYACAGEPPACGSSCKSIQDCADGFVCTSEHECIPSPTNPALAPFGCCGIPGRGSEEPWYWALLPAAAAVALARRRSRRA